ncbi:Vga family ABC-F type ribosomal protection protein [Sporolactobacillus sp. Y61]|uniref:Vga family ABC-F type ribosomal protection protein n=1 Tax=Sporolactobacillus sp. Y61 TaxID=3160863 RepID=A0AAU8IH94_9BACL
MVLLEALKIKYDVKDRLLFDIDQLYVYEHDRIGLVGPNGSGKTTLLNILAKKLNPEEGTVIQRASCELLPQLKRADTTKSGGEVTQAYIQDALFRDPELLLADEPTTNLDLEHIEWLEKKLAAWQGALILVSHDRAFLDHLCTTIWEIDDGRLNVYTGNYSDYEKQKEARRAAQQLAHEKYEKKKHQLEEALTLKTRKAERAVKSPRNPYFAKKQKKLQKTASSMKTRLNKLEKVDKVKEPEPVRMDLPNAESFKNRIIFRVKDVSGRIGERVLWKRARFLVRGGDKLAIIGPNGAGKTTLIKKMIHQEAGISRAPSVKIAYFSQKLNILDESQSILENVRVSSRQSETLIRTVLARMHFYRDDVEKRVGVLSGGERVKVALTKLFLSDMNTLILDEPTNYLDLDAASALEALLKDYEGTVVFVSHDRRFIQNVATRVLEIRNQKVRVFEGTYQQFKHFKPQKKRDLKQDQRLILDTKISEVLSRLSLEPSQELEKEFQDLLRKKKELGQ